MPRNEDAVLVDDGARVYAVVDGSGGTLPAEVCLGLLRSRAAAIEAHRARVKSQGDTTSRLAVGRFFEGLFVEASEAVRAEARRRPDQGRSAAMVIATVLGDLAFVAHVGNARAYLWRRGALRCLTVDHTLAMQEHRKGNLTAEEVGTSPFRKTLTQALGLSTHVSPDIAEVRLGGGDTLVLCSDGLHNAVDERAIAAALTQNPREDDAARALVAAANEAGGADNVSVVVLTTAADAADAGGVVDVASALGDVFLFRQLSEAERLLAAPYFELQRYPPGAVLCREGEPGDSFFTIVSGSARVTHGAAHLITLGAGDHAGEISLARRGPRTATITALTETTTLMLSRARFVELIARRPRLGARVVMALVENVGDRIVDLRSRLENIGRVLAGGLRGSDES
ncbi:MAG: cyclic nucleotide-binding domain-containing protein [Deltaproteobacteria bacterium]|nr:cyclic nucleotide-binding domain-containing protein [Deltaproteobacteria bacterium]